MHDSQIRDIGHVRWATSTALTALDLCAAALGRVASLYSVGHELDLRDFDPKKAAKQKFADRRAALSQQQLAWVDAVSTDDDYLLLQEARNALIHARLIRHLTAAPRGIETSFEVGPDMIEIDTGFPVKKLVPRRNKFPASELVAISRDLATRHVEAFLQLAF